MFLTSPIFLQSYRQDFEVFFDVNRKRDRVTSRKTQACVSVSQDSAFLFQILWELATLSSRTLLLGMCAAPFCSLFHLEIMIPSWSSTKDANESCGRIDIPITSLWEAPFESWKKQCVTPQGGPHCLLQYFPPAAQCLSLWMASL